ncbi:hypothetical protein NLI96_g5471 [Meripilus lineatus]|uniref:Endo-1,5-alpha-L-arabinanase A n=1 Tax=Meripilus lineatus TaxID=2056292 RepID=A0AAD5V2Z2_9APHY|nr:hypothetical protein NLI96_g5471 [Physisporinus lineatus]
MTPLLCFVWFSLFYLVQAVPGPIPLTGNTAVHDPTVCKDSTGKYWAFATGAGLTIRTSPDRKNWTRIGSVFPNGVPWATKYNHETPTVLWAPDCNYINGKFWVCTPELFGHLTLLLKSSGIVAILFGIEYRKSRRMSNDPHGNKWYLSFGSYWSGIKLTSINPVTGKPTGNLTSLSKRTANGGAEEASAIFKYGNYFYLFTSWDHCCRGVSSDYNIRVGRSTSIKGPYKDRNGVALLSGGGSLVLASHDGIHGPGGQDLLRDKDGPILVYHYYTANGSFLGLNRLNFTSGWPVVI